jgi:hypothetical protein
MALNVKVCQNHHHHHHHNQKPLFNFVPGIIRLGLPIHTKSVGSLVNAILMVPFPKHVYLPIPYLSAPIHSPPMIEVEGNQMPSSK